MLDKLFEIDELFRVKDKATSEQILGVSGLPTGSGLIVTVMS
jgi:hypothetical protein